HIHSNYSLLEGVITLDEIIERAICYNLPAIALTDTNAMYGLISFYKKAKEKGIKPILGAYIDEPERIGHAELACLPDRQVSVSKGVSETLKRVQGDTRKTYALFLAKNFEGYSDICR